MIGGREMEQTLITKFQDEGIIIQSGWKSGNTAKQLPQDFYCFSDYQDEKVRFASIAAVIQAAWNIVLFYKILYQEDILYPENLKNALYFHVKSGRMIFAGDEDAKMMGTKAEQKDLYNEYRAPELILGKEQIYTQDTENWTLAVYLYELFFHSGSPFHGHQSMCQVFLDEQAEYCWMASDGVFTMEENTCVNRPVHGVQDRLVKYWEIYPDVLKEAFVQIFTEGKQETGNRKNPKQWQIILNQLKTDYMICSCGASGFIHQFTRPEQGHYVCTKCSSIFYVFEAESGDSRLYLHDGVKIWGWQVFPENTQDTSCLGMVVENSRHKGVYGIKNMSSQSWYGVFPDGEEKEIRPGAGIPLWKGLRVTFEKGNTWKIKEVNEEIKEKNTEKKTEDDTKKPVEESETTGEIESIKEIKSAEEIEAKEETQEVIADELGE
jgi:hypothetical protein